METVPFIVLFCLSWHFLGMGLCLNRLVEGSGFLSFWFDTLILHILPFFFFKSRDEEVVNTLCCFKRFECSVA